jgi:hypothetical protein
MPKPGDRLQVRTRGPRRQTGHGHVLRVGSDPPQVTARMRLRGYENSQERGLLFLGSLPRGLSVYPGELADLITQR